MNCLSLVSNLHELIDQHLADLHSNFYQETRILTEEQDSSYNSDTDSEDSFYTALEMQSLRTASEMQPKATPPPLPPRKKQLPMCLMNDIDTWNEWNLVSSPLPLTPHDQVFQKLHSRPVDPRDVYEAVQAWTYEVRSPTTNEHPPALRDFVANLPRTHSTSFAGLTQDESESDSASDYSQSDGGINGPSGKVPIAHGVAVTKYFMEKIVNSVETQLKVGNIEDLYYFMRKNQKLLNSIKYFGWMEAKYSYPFELNPNALESESDDTDQLDEELNMILQPTTYADRARQLMSDFKEHPVPDLDDLWEHQSNTHAVRKDIINMEWYSGLRSGSVLAAKKNEEEGQVACLQRFWELKNVS